MERTERFVHFAYFKRVKLYKFQLFSYSVSEMSKKYDPIRKNRMSIKQYNIL